MPAVNPTVAESLEARLDRIERVNAGLVLECRRWRRRAVGVLAAGAVLALAGAASRAPKVVEAEHFVLRDAGGRMRASLAVRPDGTPGLGFFDESGRLRLSLDLGAQGTPAVNLMDGIGRPQAALAVRPDATPGLGLFDPLGRVRLSLDIGPQGAPGVNVFGDGGRLRAALAIRPDGSPGLGLFDPDGQVQVSVESPGPERRPEPSH